MVNLGDFFYSLGTWLQGLLVRAGMSESAAHSLFSALVAAVLPLLALMTAIPLIWLERKWIARLQDRMGPNRVGPFGLLQVFADMIKIFTKEDITPRGADRVVFALAPVLAVAGVLGLWAVIPFAANAFGVDLNVGVLYLVAVGTLSTLAIMLAGWSANNKYALLGAFRTVAQMISYEVPLVLSLLVPVLLSGSLGLNGIVSAQREVWFVFSAPLAALLFLIASQAEVSRAPFDLLEAESEIVAGFNIEYSGMKFGFFFVGEFLHSFTMGLLGATLFLGGWTGPGVDSYPALGALYLILKGTFVYFIFVWARATFPRIRIDQMLNFNWKLLTPLGLFLIPTLALVNRALSESSPWLRSVALLGANILLAVAVLLILGLRGRAARMRAVSAAHVPAASTR
jgi:NADH-quinone oxidoreductase subunit H